MSWLYSPEEGLPTQRMYFMKPPAYVCRACSYDISSLMLFTEHEGQLSS